VLSGKKPDSFSIGYFGSIYDWNYYEGTNAQLGQDMIGADLGFSLLWHDTLNQRGKQTYSFKYGIAETQKDSNLNKVPLKPDLTQLANHYTNKPVWIQSGCDAGDGIWIELGEMNCKAIGIEKLDVSTVEGAIDALDRLGGALNYISGFRSRLGAQQNRLEHTIANESNIVENTTSAESLIRDADMADMMVTNSLENVLMQAGQAMLAQANTSLQGLLSLLQQ
jgi:flagellin-like hook-associated protein FlgL